MSVADVGQKAGAGPSPAVIALALRDFRLGGSERIALLLANFWASLGLRVIVLAGRGQGPLRELLREPVEIVDLGLPAWLGESLLPWGLALRIWRLIRQRGRSFDAFYIPGNSHWPVVPFLSVLPVSLRPVLVAQVSSPVRRPGRCKWSQRFYALRTRFLLRGADHVTTLSGPLARDVAAMTRRDDITVVPLPALCDTEPRNLRRASGQNILAAGRLVPVKGFDVLLQAFDRVRAQCPDATLTLCGEGPERARLEREIDRLGLGDSVVLTGFVPCIGPYLEICRVFALSSHCESFGAVLLEALAAGRQVVSTRCSPAVTDLIACDDTGRIVPPADPSALAEALIAILETDAPDAALLSSCSRPYHVSRGGRHYLELMGKA